MPESPLILVLDDDTRFTEVLCRSLQRRGMRTLCANTLAEALEQARQTPPSHAVCDLKLAGETGLDASEPLLSCNPDMKLLILTGYSIIATAVTAIKRGAFDYAPKPLDTDAILHKLGLGPAAAEEEEPEVPDTPPSVDRIEWEHIQRVLAENDYNLSATARSLRMHRRTLQRKLQKRPVRS